MHAITQDFYRVIFLATLESILSKPALAAFSAQGEARECRSTPQVNRAVSYVTVLDHIVPLLGDMQRSPASTLAAIERVPVAMKLIPTDTKGSKLFLTHLPSLRVGFLIEPAVLF